MSTEEIYEAPKSKVRDAPKPFPPVVRFSPIPNIVIAVIATSILNYLAAYVRYTAPNGGLMLSPFFGGLLFPISAIISIALIAYTGNREKMTSEKGVTFGIIWFLSWRCYVVNMGAVIISAIFTLALGMNLESGFLFFLAIFWVVATPLCSWLFFSKNKRQNIFWVAQLFRGY